MEKTFTKEIYDKLVEAVEKLPDGAIERTKKSDTRKGYDTTGYQYQFLVNILNEVIGPSDWGFDYTIIKEVQGSWESGRPFYDITTEVSITILGATRKCVGGHRAESHSDALKGAITNGFKKTIAFFGVGKKAYEGTVDEDYRPVPVETKKPTTKKLAPKPTSPKEIADTAYRAIENAETVKNLNAILMRLNEVDLEAVTKDTLIAVAKAKIAKLTEDEDNHAPTGTAQVTPDELDAFINNE